MLFGDRTFRGSGSRLLRRSFLILGGSGFENGAAGFTVQGLHVLHGVSHKCSRRGGVVIQASKKTRRSSSC